MRKVLIAGIILLLGGCGSALLSPQQATQLNQAYSDATMTVSDSLTKAQAQLVQDQALPQTPENTKKVEADTKAVKDLTKILENLNAAKPTVTNVTNVATQPNPTPTDVYHVAAPLIPEPYRVIGEVVSIGLTALFGFLAKKKADSNTSSVTNAVGAGVASGKIQVLKGAGQVVDSAVNGHKSTDAIVDIVANAEKDK